MTDPLSGWIRFLASSAAPATALRPVELEGYLASIVVAPDMPMPSLWMEGAWGDEEPIFDGQAQAQEVLGSLVLHYNLLADRIADEGVAFRPSFMDADRAVDLDKARLWARGFWRAMKIDGAGWSRIVADKSARFLIVPMISLVDIPEAELPVRTDEELREMCEVIPACLAELRDRTKAGAGRAPLRRQPRRSAAPGRNDPCPCGSGRKYKRCCGMN